MTTIGKQLGLRDVAAHTFSKATPANAVDPALIYGVELEIESASTGWRVGGMEVKEDGSLRNNGLEFVTNPMTYSHLAFCLRTFFDKSKVTANNYSERCSVHVHTNVQDLTFDQVSTITLLYQTFENLLFSFIGDDRDKSIFCVPWSQTTLTYDVINKIKGGNTSALKRWQKYTALNLLPMFSLGTIEWRHMAGTHDMERIMLWCRIIARMFAWARKHAFEETKGVLVGLNTTSHYRNVLFEVFGEEAAALQVEGYDQLLEDGVLQLKYAILSAKDEVKTAKPAAPEVFGFDPVPPEEDDDELIREFAEPRNVVFNRQAAPAEVPHMPWQELAQRNPFLAAQAQNPFRREVEIQREIQRLTRLLPNTAGLPNGQELLRQAAIRNVDARAAI